MNTERRSKAIADPSLAENPNYVAYMAQKADLKREYPGKWVAFYDGKLVFVGDDRKTLREQTMARGMSGVLLQHIVKEESVTQWRGARKASRD